jgi:uncharacterized membrane protein
VSASKPAEPQPARAAAAAKPAETKSAETKPAETKPAETKPAETKPAQATPVDAPPAVPPTERLRENVAAMLCYLVGWVSGLGFLLMDRRPFVRYHAAQSVVIFGVLSLLLLVLGDFMFGSLFPHAGGVLSVLQRIVEIVWVVAAVMLMLKANAGERYRVAFAASFGDRAAQVKP